MVLDEIHSVEETLAAIENLWPDIDAIFRIPSRTLNPESELITQAGIKLGIPSFASLLLDEDVSLTFTADFTVAGQQAARLAHQIFNWTGIAGLIAGGSVLSELVHGGQR